MDKDRDEQFIHWLRTHDREGYVEPFIYLQKHSPNVLAGLDNDDWVDIFMKLKPAGLGDTTVDLCAMFSSVSLG